MEKQLLKSPNFYRFIAGFRKNANTDKFVFSKYIKRGETVIDCGANIGYYTNFFRTIVGKKGCVHAFEPVPSTFEYLTKNILEYSRCKNYRLNMAGLYKTETTKYIYIPDSISGHASLNEHQKAWNAYKIDRKEIKLTTLDTYVKSKGIKEIDFIKMDIEGAEIEALKGGKQTLSEHLPTLHLEVNSQLLKNFKQKPADLLDFLKTIGYKIFYYYDSNPKILNCCENLIYSNQDINTNVIAKND